MAAPGNGVLMPQSFFGLRRWWLALVGVVLIAVVCFGCPAVSQAAWRLPKRLVPAANPMGPAFQAGSAHLQEVSPPVAVQQFKDALGEKLPQLKILEPANGAMVADGAWTLRVEVSDWPLIDGGSLGLGPHLLVIVDGEPPRVLTTTETEMPPLGPGSHRLTVATAWPWGEVNKSHGAFDQIRLHRAAANPLAVPPPGSAQLFVTSPISNANNIDQPVLLDWLLIDAPLQNLRQNDASWRLRITVNGESFLVDQQTPLWLSGWRSRANALLWELVDRRGEPLNPPFNSIVSELHVEDSKMSRPSNFSWLSGPINSDDLAVMLGNASPVPPAPQAQKEPLPSMAIQPENVTPLQQEEVGVSNSNAMQFDKNKMLPEPSSEEIESGELPEDLSHGLEAAEPERGPDLSPPTEPMNSIAEAVTTGVPHLETPPPEPPLPAVPAQPEIPMAEASSMGAAAERRERDQPVTLLPDPAPRLEDLDNFPVAAGEGENLDATIIPPPSEGVLARLGQGLRRRLGHS